jgi:hypothetical protein
MFARPQWLTSWRAGGSEQELSGLPAKDKNREKCADHYL